MSHELLGRESLPRAASWSFQQSAEKALKAIWSLNRERIPRAHDLAYLLSELSEYYELSAVVDGSRIITFGNNTRDSLPRR